MIPVNIRVGNLGVHTKFTVVTNPKEQSQVFFEIVLYNHEDELYHNDSATNFVIGWLEPSTDTGGGLQFRSCGLRVFDDVVNLHILKMLLEDVLKYYDRTVE